MPSSTATITNSSTVATSSETRAEKAKRMNREIGPAAYSVRGESTTLRSVDDMIKWDKYCSAKEAAADPCSTVLDCNIEVGKPCSPGCSCAGCMG